MDLVRVICGMLGVALFLGILTCGGNQDDQASVTEELENTTISDSPSGMTGQSLAEEENTTIEQNVLKPVPPDSLILAKGESELANERRNIENKTRATVRLFEAQGESLFPGFVEPESPWYNRDFCIFVWTINGTQVVCPEDRSSEGKDMKGLMDADGRPIGELFIETAQSENGEGWIDYSWKESGNSEPSRKLTFVKKATFEGRAYIIGSSFYLDDNIISRNLSDCKYLEEPGNIHVAELLNPENIDKNIDLNYSIAHAVIEPEESIAPHLIKNPEVHYILEGEGILYIDGIPVELYKDQVIYIPAGAIQTTYNTGNTSLRFLAINQPGWSEENTEVFE
jgi:mannose-6-phosphate isomerase-like protein (cupin superfamily)